MNSCTSFVFNYHLQWVFKDSQTALKGRKKFQHGRTDIGIQRYTHIFEPPLPTNSKFSGSKCLLNVSHDQLYKFCLQLAPLGGFEGLPNSPQRPKITILVPRSSVTNAGIQRYTHFDPTCQPGPILLCHNLAFKIRPKYGFGAFPPFFLLPSFLQYF